MSQDGINFRGAPKSSRIDAGGSNLITVAAFGIVKNNFDKTRSGRIDVYIESMSGSDPDNAESWITVSWASPFYGFVTNTASDSGNGSYTSNSNSYGVWNSPPDIGTTVICIFINGDPNYGFYIGCVPNIDAMHMVPAIGATEKVIPSKGENYGGATRLPVNNINNNNDALTYKSDFYDQNKPIHSYVATVMFQQGIIKDPIRGPISSSANRESPSRVGWGISSPGRPIYQGGTTDDQIEGEVKTKQSNPKLQVVARRGGHSIVMDDGDRIGQNNMIRLRSSLGHQITMSDDGQTIFVIHANGQSWVELGKEGTIDMFAMNSVNVRTLGDLNLHADRNININAIKDLNIHAENININSDKETAHLVGTDYRVNTKGKYTHKVEQQMSMWSAGDASYHSDATNYINGAKVHLNTGDTSTVPKPVKPIPIITHPDTIFDSEKGWNSSPGLLKTINNRAPTHTPWAFANQGVEIKVSGGAAAALPSAPSAAVAATAAAGANTSGVPTSMGQMATTPNPGAVSSALSSGTTAALASQTAVSAASSVKAAAVAAGAGIAKAQAVVGALGHGTSQLAQAGIVKPGSNAILDAVASKTKSITSTMTDNMFTGVPGAEKLDAIKNNVVSQIAAQTTLLQKAQTGLAQAGVLTGREAPGAISGLVMAAANNGLSSTIGAVNNLAKGGVSNLTNNPILKTIGAGNFASNLSQSVAGGLGAVSTAVKAMGPTSLNMLKGIEASAFDAITNAIPSIPEGSPINLESIAGTTARMINAAGATTAATFASGITNLPGGAKTISSIIDSAPGALNTLPGITELQGLANRAVGEVQNLARGAQSLANNAAGGLTKALSSLAAGPAAQINSAMASLGSSGPIPSKSPAVGINTVDRSAVESSIASKLADSKIPKPNYTGEISDAAKSDADAVEAETAEIAKLIEDTDALYEQAESLSKQYFTALETSSPTAPNVTALKKQWDALVAQANDKLNNLNT